jgi:hypothetical protein
VKWELVYGSPTTVDPVLAVGAIYKSAALGGQTDGLGEGKEKEKKKKKEKNFLLRKGEGTRWEEASTTTTYAHSIAI